MPSSAIRKLAAFGAIWARLAAPALAEGPSAINFNEQIRPILSDKCYACHGPDEHKRKAGLRLDRKESAFRELKSGHHALVAGKPGESSLIARITSSDPEEKMPPPDSTKSLS
ncbi:MAG TPA: c-type cytochrome domain-containing protein, partial [Verrucomicrobiae bacterium]|nr:c-type cytochrome domain-containing protein [Verrucomicrobiae bacterium]